MHRLNAVLLAGLVIVLPLLAQDDPPKTPEPPAGNWKFFLPLSDRDAETALWLIQFEKKDDKWTGKVLDTARNWPEMKVQDLSVTPTAMRFTLKSSDLSLPCEVKLVKGAEVLRGTGKFTGEVTPIELHPTKIASLEGLELARESLAKKPLGVDAAQLALGLISRAEANKVKPAEVRAWADKATKSAELYGPGWHREVLLLVATFLNRQKGYEPIALQHAQRAERMLDAKEPPALQQKVLEVLATALEKDGKKEEAAQVKVRLGKLDFRVKVKTYAGRKAKSDRVVLVEMFTGAGSKPSVATDQATEALARTFKPGEVVILNYHVHAPDPDPLAIEDVITRVKFYKDSLRSFPTLFLDGKVTAPGGGAASEAQRKYDEYYDAIVASLERPAEAKLKLSAVRKGPKVTIEVESSKVKDPEDVKLRLALVEEQVAYKGGNGITAHNNVVRALPGGDAGYSLTEKGVTKKITLDIDDLIKKHKAYLDKYAEDRPFPNKERPLELKKLKVVAFLQNEKTDEVLQTAVVEVKEEAKGE